MGSVEKVDVYSTKKECEYSNVRWSDLKYIKKLFFVTFIKVDK